MAAVTYEVGDAIPLEYTIAAAATVTLTVTDPAGAVTTPVPSVAGTAPAVTYSAAVEATSAGLWRFRFAATGAVIDAEGGSFYVGSAVAATIYTTLPELKASLSIPATDTADDDDLTDAILAASRAIDGDCQRHFYRIAEVRTLEPMSPWLVRLGPYMDLVSVVTLKTGAAGDGTWETTWATTDYQLLCADGTPNVNAGPEPRPYRRVKTVGTQTFPTAWSRGVRTDLVRIDGVWGWPTVPDRIRRAARMAAAEAFKLRDAPLGALGFADLGIVRVRDNPKYLRLIDPYRLQPVPVA